jgi:flagellar motor protein MotB
VASSGPDPFSHSMTDLMAGVAVTFLLIAGIFIVQAANQAEAEARAGRAAQAKLEKIVSTDQRAIAEIKSLRDLLSGEDALRELVDVAYDEQRDPFLLTIVFNRGRLDFAEGNCAIADETKAVMTSSFGTIFERVCNSASSGFIEAIALEGHTDNHPFFPSERVCGVEGTRSACARERGDTSGECAALGFANNVRLSAARAQNVFFHMREVLRERPEIIACLESKFVVSGRGPVEPTDGQAWEIKRSNAENERNRRVVIKVRATSRTRERR